MRTHFPGVLRQVRSAARFPLGAAGRVDAGRWRDFFGTNSKENRQMEKELTATAAAVPNHPTEAKCPVKVGARTQTGPAAPTNVCGWPSQLRSNVRPQNAPRCDPM